MPTPPRPHAQGFHEHAALRVSAGLRETFIDRTIAEAPVALMYNGVPFAVMMATPCDLGDFALGFALAEGIVESASEFELVDMQQSDRGVTLQGLIPAARFEALQARRNLTGRSGCGLCGVEALQDAVRPLPRVQSPACFSRDAIAAGMRALARGQSLNTMTGGAHATAFVIPGQPATVREDVGRHNALDKVIGGLALTRPTRDALFAHTSQGFAAITSRASWEMLHKAAHAGIAVMAAISAPTSLAIEAADAAGITLVAFAREESMNVYTHPERVA
ncbi:MAG TPA: formate dehydrogenase accessory sulfurtransferase FdhD [Rhodanobacteraceae bacterium]|jgi:formate dehydrogenase accessory protein FdhD|nr:formate dehydrogenase accessory sulfurtransferase FdhD [Rhodanobacteraceae bacterium]